MAVLDDLFSRRVLFVTGKGGVGKSSVAAALAVLAAERGLRTLVIDVEAKGDAARFLDAAPPRYRAARAIEGVHHLALDPEEILQEYLKVSMHVPRLYRVGPVSKVFEFIATAAPGIREVLVAGKVGFEERATADGRKRWDLIVVDAAPSGQVLSHLRGPRTISELVGVGMIRNQTAWVRDILEDPATTGMVVVSLLEEMPVSETEELLAEAPKRVPTPVLALVANRVVAEPPGPLDELDGIALDAAALMADIAANQAPYRDRLQQLGPPVVEIPFLGLARHDLAATRTIAGAMSTPEHAVR